MTGYSKLLPSYRGKKRNTDGTYSDADFLYNYINRTITSNTIEKRKQFKGMLDDFCTFWWRGIDAFETFGAFIINKNDLKFYNGPSFSNDYTQPQFESAAGQLTGVKFKTQQISFTIGVYWISIEHYRQLIYWLHPYEISTLVFGFDQEHYYQVKLANIADSTRNIIGKETVDGKVEPRYYTELKLTFEIQGSSCAYNLDEFNIVPSLEQSGSEHNAITGIIFNIDENDNDANIGSDLPAPIQANFSLKMGLDIDNFRVNMGDNPEYNLIKTEWHLIAEPEVAWPTDDDANYTDPVTQDKYFILGLENPQEFKSDINPDGSFVTYDAIKINITQHKIYYYIANTNTNTLVYDSNGWVKDTYRIIQFTDDQRDNLDKATGVTILSFLIQNTLIEYYTNMKVNCVLSVRMRENLDSEYPSAPLEEKMLFNVTLKNLTWGNHIEDIQNRFDLGYDSESGLLYMLSGDSQYFLLNTLSTSAKGQRIVDEMEVNTFAISGLFEDPLFDIKNLDFILRMTVYGEDTIVNDLTFCSDRLYPGATIYLNHFVGLQFDNNGTYISLRGRTNLI